MTAEEIIAEVRLLASDLAIRGACPGEVSPSLQYRIIDFLHRAGTPFKPWRDHRKYLTKTRTAIVDEKEVPCQVHKGVVDDTAGELCREIAQSLMLAKWDKLPAYKDWTSDRAEQAIREAVARLPVLCEKLEAIEAGMDLAAKTPQYVTLDQMAIVCGKSKRTLENWKTKGWLPSPDIEGGGGKADEWIWENVRDILSQKSGRLMQPRYPSLIPT